MANKKNSRKRNIKNNYVNVATSKIKEHIENFAESDAAEDMVKRVLNKYNIPNSPTDRITSEETLKETKLQEEETQEKIHLDKEQEKLSEEQLAEAKKAQNDLRNFHPIPNSIQSNTSTVLGGNTSAQDTADEAEEEKQEEADMEADINEETREEVTKLESERDEKIEKLKQGPHGLITIFTSVNFFWLLALIDSAVSSIFPVVGDFIMVIILAVVWFIPCILIFDLFLYVKILFFLFIDWAVGTFGGTPANLIIPFGGDFFVDLLPEIFVTITHTSPVDLIKKAYFEKLPLLIAQTRNRYKIRISEIKAEGKNKIHFALKKLRGHFAGVAGEGKKVIFVFLIAVIVLFSQVWPILGINSTSEIIMTGFFVLLLFALKSINFLGSREFNGLVAFMAFNIFFEYILTADSFILKYLGSSNSAILTVLFVVLTLLFILKEAKPESMPTHRIIGIMAVFVLILSLAYVIPYVGSDNFTSDIQKKQVEQEVKFSNMNFKERIVNWFDTMQKRGNGTYIPLAQKEQVHKFIGITLEGVEATRKEFPIGSPIQFNIFYSTGSKVTKKILTTCDTQGMTATTIPKTPIPANELYTPSVKCIFEALPKGSHVVTVNSYFVDSSQIEIPLMFMSSKKQFDILQGQEDPATYQGGVPKPITSSGPIDFGVSNTARKGEFKMPLIIDEEKLNKFPKIINIRLENPIGDASTQGKIKNIQKMEFNLPEGLQLQNCNFQSTATQGLIEPTSKEDHRWKVDITHYFTSEINPYETISCNLYIDESYIKKYNPITTQFSLATAYYNIEYTYALEKKVPVTIV